MAKPENEEILNNVEKEVLINNQELVTILYKNSISQETKINVCYSAIFPDSGSNFNFYDNLEYHKYNFESTTNKVEIITGYMSDKRGNPAGGNLILMFE